MPELLEDLSGKAAEIIPVLNELAQDLSYREKLVKQRLDYYQGAHKLAYASPEFSSYFGSQFEGFSDNWCAPVVESPAERMNLLGIRLGDERSVDKELATAWRAAGGERGSSEAFVVMLAASRAFATVWGDEDDNPTIDWERPDQAIIRYDPDRRKRTHALKLWRDEKKEYATVYTPESVWKFERDSFVDGRTQAGVILPVSAASIGGWKPRQPSTDDTWPIPNPMGVVPMVELRNQTLLDDNPMSDIDGVSAMQDAINLVWAYLMNALDYASLPQRIVTGADMPTLPVLNKEGQVIGRKPVELDQLVRDRILWVPSPNAKTSEWTAANLAVFSDVIERAIEHIAAQTRTPPHYLIGKIQNVAAEALTAAETGLVSKTNERVTYVTPELRELQGLVALAMGDEAKALACRSGVLHWSDIQFRALSQKVDALVKARQMGFPFEWIAEQYGLEPSEVERVIRMKEREEAQSPTAQILRGMNGQMEDADVVPAGVG